MNEVSETVLFFGRFHPLVVHLPIGFLFFAFLLEVFARWKQHSVIRSAIPLALLLGTISALVACILGYMLSLSGDYEENALDTHFWLGVATTIVAFAAWLISAEKVKVPKLQQGKPYMATLTLIVILLSVTGHYGGNLTHGSDYLTAYLPFGKKEKKEMIAVTSVEEAQVFGHLVQPILENKCASCHNASKKKGQLSFADQEAILEGGKSGPIVTAGAPSQSEMIRRVQLNSHHDDFMPPKGKTPLTKEEISILSYWIAQGNADFQTKISTVETSADIKLVASQMLGLSIDAKQEMVLAEVPEIASQTMNELLASGLKLNELVAGTNLFDVSLPANTKGITSEKISGMIAQLAVVGDNIMWLSLPSNEVKDEHLKTIATFKNLKKLRLEKNPITDVGVNHLSSLQELESLNLYQTKVTNDCINVFSKMKSLKKVYVWGTAVKADELPDLPEETFPDLVL